MQQLHFVTSADNKVGKSWFIRGAVEYFRQSMRVVVVDTSSDKRLGSIYNPNLNKIYNLRFGYDNSLLADLLIDLAQHNISAIVKVPASDRIYFEQWVEDIDLLDLGIDSYYWFVGRADREIVSTIPKAFDRRLHCVLNQFSDGNLLNNKISSRIFTLPRFGSNRDTNEIEMMNLGLKDSILAPNTSLIGKARIIRFLDRVKLEIVRISAHS